MSDSYIGKAPQYGFFEKQRITTANGVLTEFNLAFTCADSNQLLVSVGGVIQEGGIAYTVLSGTPQQISFTEAPATGVEIFIVFLGKQTTGPTFSSAMLTDKTALGAQPASDDEFLLYDTSASGLKKVDFSYMQAAMGDITEVQGGTGITVTNATGPIPSVAVATNYAGGSSIATVGTITTGTWSGTAIAAGKVANDLTISGGAIDNTPIGAITAAPIVATQVDITAQGDLRLQDTSGGEYVALQAAGTTTSYTVTMPATTAASNGQALTITTAGIGSWSTVGDASLAAAQEWTAQQNFNNTTLSFDATQDWALSANQVATLTLTANTTFDAPTQMVDGAFYSLIIIQDGTGGRTASWNAVFKWAAGTAPTLTTTASAKDIFVWRSDGTNMYEVGRQLNVS